MILIVKKVVHSDPQIMHGIPVFVGTRVPVQVLWDSLADGVSLINFLAHYPSVKREQAAQAIDEAGALYIERVNAEKRA